jgi:hypothetical protein
MIDHHHRFQCPALCAGCAATAAGSRAEPLSIVNHNSAFLAIGSCSLAPTQLATNAVKLAGACSFPGSFSDLTEANVKTSKY